MGRQDTYLEHLSQVPMFSVCSKKELTLIMRRSQERTVAAGTKLTEEGKPGDELFIIFEGECRITRNGKRVTDLGPGDFFGELALLDKPVRDATITATSPMTVLVVRRREFEVLLIEVPSIARKLLRALAQRLHSLDALP